jgi:hypothetical protein
VDDSTPFLRFHAHKQLITPHPSIVDQDIHASKRLNNLFKSYHRGCIVGDVKLEDLTGTPHLLEGRYHLLSCLTLASTRHGDARARPPKRQGNRPANTA